MQNKGAYKLILNYIPSFGVVLGPTPPPPKKKFPPTMVDGMQKRL